MLELLSLPYSPWSEKARWALDARGLLYVKRPYYPLIGEPGLRVLLRRPLAPVSVPVLIDGTQVISESSQIAKYADAHGSGAKLFLAGQEATIGDFDAASERGLSAGRALALMRMLEDREALAEQVPAGALRVLGSRMSAAVARAGVERTLRKYAASDISAADHHAMLSSVLVSLRADLARSRSAEPKTLLGHFSYADIVMSQVLCFVEPPQTPHVRLAPGSRRCFTDMALRAQFGDLIAWRNALYARYREPAFPVAAASA